MSVEIRAAVAADKPHCLALLHTLRASTGAQRPDVDGAIFEQLLEGARGAVVLAQEGGLVLGMASVSYNLALRHDGEYCQLEELVVSPEARGRNVGGLLVQRIVDDARARGCAEIGLYLVERTEHNRPFYAKYGFEAVGTEMRQRFDGS